MMLLDWLVRTLDAVLSRVKKDRVLSAALNVHLGPTQRMRLPHNLDGKVRLYGDPELDMSLELNLKECDALMSGLLAVAGDLPRIRIVTTDGEFLLAQSGDSVTAIYQGHGLIPRFCKSYIAADVIKAATEYQLKRENYDANGAYRLNRLGGSVG